MKKNIYAAIAVIILFIISGCKQDSGVNTDTVGVNTDTVDNLENADIELIDLSDSPFIGKWDYKNKNESISLDIVFNEKNEIFIGNFLAIYSTEVAPAKYIDEGGFQGELSKFEGENNVLFVEWAGDRKDSGAARLVYDDKNDMIEWKGFISERDSLYTLPEEMQFIRSEN